MPKYLGGAPSIFPLTITPVSNDGAALGTAALSWSDLFLASGAVINAGNGEVTLTFGADTLTLAGGQLVMPDGSAAAPSISRVAQATGFAFGSTFVDIIGGGTIATRFEEDSVRLRSVTYIGWTDGAASATVDTRVERESAAILQQGVDSATPVAQTYKGPDGSGTNVVGGVMRVASGRTTGNADPAILSFQGTAVSVTSGSTQQTLIDRFIPNAFVILTDGSATAVVNVTVATETVTGGILSYTIEVTDGTDVQVESGQAVYSTSNKAGTVVGTITEINSQQNLSVGTLATTWAISNANPAVISVNANSSLTPSTGYPRITFSLSNLGQQAVAIQ